MQCLFCGKELALLKRLRGGGEFCSEAHRKEYQDQYEQLALARLLQAKQPVEPAAPLGRPAPAPPVVAALPAETPHVNVPAPARQDPQVPSRRAIARPPIAMIEAPASRPTAEEAGPAPLAGFVKDPLVPAVTSFVPAGPLELVVVSSLPSLPPGGSSASSATSGASGQEGSLPPAPPVEFEFSLQALDHHTRNSERGVELREFTGPAPLIELHLRPETAPHPVATADVMEILMSPHPPQKATPWLGVPRGFPAAPAELGDLARLDFTTTGFAYSDGAASASAVEIADPPQAAPEPVSRPEPPVQLAPEVPEVVVAPESVEVRAEVTQVELPPSAEVPVPAEPAPPALVTKALPVTLHGLAAPRGKLADTFTAAIVLASDVRVPVSAALPLRPTIVFGPAPAPAPAPQAPVPATAAPEPPARMVKPAHPVPENPPSQFKSAMIPVPKGVPVKRPAAPESPAQERKAPKVAASSPIEKPVEKRVEPRVERQAGRPAATAYDAVPSLHLQTTESAWSKLSTGLKIGVAAAVIVGLSGIAFLVTRGGSKTTTPAPAANAAPATAAVASGVPISGGWIEDWANASKTRRRISLFSGSAKLSDYRLEFQAQIETKAVGWVFRGQNPRNYYVAKLETTKPGLEPTVALVHFAVVDGQDENRVAVPLPMKVRLDTTYKIRFEAVGNRFTTWVQDQKIDEWTDSRFGSGGVGLFSEREEQAALQGNVNVIALVPKN